MQVFNSWAYSLLPVKPPLVQAKPDIVTSIDKVVLINPFTDSNEFIRLCLQLNSGRQRIYSFSKSNGKKRLLYTNNWMKNDVNGVVVTTIYK